MSDEEKKFTGRVDPLLTGSETPPGTRLKPCAECKNGIGRWWPTCPNCWKCGQPTQLPIIEERPPVKTRWSARNAADPGAATSPEGAGGPTAETSLAASSVQGELVARPDAMAPAMPAPRRKSRAQKHIEFITRIDQSLRKQSASIVLDMYAAREVPDDGSRPPEWSDKKWRTARDARNPDKDAPAYIRHATRILESYRRSEALEDRKPSPTLNCDIQVYVRQEVTQTYNYEVIESKDE